VHAEADTQSRAQKGGGRREIGAHCDHLADKEHVVRMIGRVGVACGIRCHLFEATHPADHNDLVNVAQPSASKTCPPQPVDYIRTAAHQMPKKLRPVVLNHQNYRPLIQTIVTL